MEEEYECGKPCPFDSQCNECGEYWDRMIDEGLWNESKKEWTDKAVKMWML
ncbi:MAG: hypothetical protein AABY22_28150 [Nanoarchaeota archaeon]